MQIQCLTVRKAYCVSKREVPVIVDLSKHRQLSLHSLEHTHHGCLHARNYYGKSASGYRGHRVIHL